MPFKLPSIPGIASGEQQKQEASLDDILPAAAQRVDLLVLVAVCTDHMRNNLTACFENQDTSTNSSKAATAEEYLIEGQDDRSKDTQEGRLDLQWARNMELSSSRMQDLRRNGVEYFNTWRSAVLRRMGEAMSVKSDAVRNAKAQYTTANRTAAYHAWAEGGDSLTEPKDEVLKPTVPFPKVVLPATTQKLDEKSRALVLGAVLFMLLSLENYTAYSRVLMSYLCQSLALPYDVLSSEEVTAASTLLRAASEMNAEEARKKQADEGAFGRKLKIGLATVAGAVVIGISGGLAAPIVLGVAGTIMGGIGLGGLATLLGATIVNPVTIAALFGALGGRMTSSAMQAYTKEVEDFRFVPIHEAEIQPTPAKKAASPEATAAPTHKLRVAIGISGWVTKESDISLPWRVFSPTTVEPFALQFEKEAMISLGTSLDKTLKDTAYSYVQGRAIGLVLPTLAAAMAPMGLLNTGKFIDNPFTIAMERSDKAGKVLAHALMDKAQGERPVTLVGFSLGARVIYSCLEELSAHDAFGLVENAILIGSPIPSDEIPWRRMRAMVAGRLINVYTQRDMLLGFLYRARNIQLGIAGLQAITAAPNVENKDVSHIVTGHNQYRLATGRILKELDFADLDTSQVEQVSTELEHEKIYEKEVHDEAKREGRLKDVVDEQGEIVMVESTQKGERGVESKPSSAEIGGLSKQLENTTLDGENKPALPTRPAKINHPDVRQAEAEDQDGEEDDELEEDHQPIQMADIEPDALPDSPLEKTTFQNTRAGRG